MTIKELVEELNVALEQHGDIEVVMAKDGEVNGASPLSDLDYCYYREETAWSGDVVYVGDVVTGEVDQDTVSPIILLYPTN